MPTRLEMSQAEYARHRRVTRPAIHKLIKAGKIQLVPSEDDPRRKVIDVAAADFALGETRERLTIRDDDDPAARGEYVPPPEGSGGQLTKARTATEIYRARLAQLEYDREIGKLLLREDVEQSIRLCAESIARDLEAIANSATDLAAAFRQGEEAGLRLALKQMTRRVQQTLADNLRVLAAPPPPLSSVMP